MPARRPRYRFFTSPPKPIFVVPLQVLPPRPMLGALGNPQPLPVELGVALLVVEVRVDVVADLEVVVRCDGHIAGIEQLVDIGSQQEPVLELSGLCSETTHARRPAHPATPLPLAPLPLNASAPVERIVHVELVHPPRQDQGLRPSAFLRPLILRLRPKVSHNRRYRRVVLEAHPICIEPLIACDVVKGDQVARRPPPRNRLPAAGLHPPRPGSE